MHLRNYAVDGTGQSTILNSVHGESDLKLNIILILWHRLHIEYAMTEFCQGLHPHIHHKSP